MELTDGTLMHPPWQDREGLGALVDALGPGAARFVGGAVRDALLGQEAADLDLATVHSPGETMRRLREAGIRAVPTGIEHGTVTAVLPSGPVEVTTLRRDVESVNGRHAVVAFTEDWREDAARRDFTINALYAAPGEPGVFDYFGGLSDLAARRVRFIGDPLQRIAEDHLRILRYFRFHARFGDALDEAGRAACRARANDLMALSRERIAAELLKLLALPGAVATVAMMEGDGIFRPVVPEVSAAGVARLAALGDAERAAGLSPDPIRALAALLPPQAAEPVAMRLKLSNADRKRLGSASGPLGHEGDRALAYRIGPEGAIDRLLLHGADPSAIVDWPPPRLPLSGGALVARGIGKGPAVATALKEVERRWIAEGFPDASRVELLADAVAAQARSAAII